VGHSPGGLLLFSQPGQDLAGGKLTHLLAFLLPFSKEVYTRKSNQKGVRCLTHLVAFSSSSSQVRTWRTFRRKVEAVLLMSPRRSRRAAPTPTSVSMKFEIAIGRKRGRGLLAY